MEGSAGKRARAVPGVLVVDDSALMRSLLVELIAATGEFRVVGEASTGFEAIRLVHELDPELVTLDLEMPDLSGLEALGYIMSEAPRPVVVVSAGGESALRALDYGAVDVIAKPAGGADRAGLKDRLLDALRAAAVARLANLKFRTPQRARETRTSAAGAGAGPAGIAVMLAASTGGPRALADLVPRLPADLPAAVLIVQHMPPRFTGSLAARLDAISDLTVTEARDGDAILPGHAYIAPGGVHLVIRRAAAGNRLALSHEPAVWGVRPSADLLFTSAASHFGPRSAGVVLTGMGRDGSEGLRAMRAVGAWTACQDEESSVIYGMPKAAARHAREILPLERIPEAVVTEVERLVSADRTAP